MCATLQLPLCKLYSLLWRVPQAGGIPIELKGEKSCGNSVIILCSTCGISDFGQFLAVSGRTTACKRGITNIYICNSGCACVSAMYHAHLPFESLYDSDAVYVYAQLRYHPKWNSLKNGAFGSV